VGVVATERRIGTHRLGMRQLAAIDAATAGERKVGAPQSTQVQEIVAASGHRPGYDQLQTGVALRALHNVVDSLAD
jgi:hypothetical protein